MQPKNRRYSSKFIENKENEMKYNNRIYSKRNR